MFGGLIDKLLPGQASPGSECTDDEDDTEVLLSLERSRKRHLSPGVLRGDRVADYLKVQEASASPCLKRPRPGQEPVDCSPPGDVPQEPGEPANMALTASDFYDYMDKRVNGRLDAIDSTMSGMQSSVQKIDRNVQLNNSKLDAHHSLIQANTRAISDMKIEMDRIKNKATADRQAPAPPPLPGALCPSPGPDRDTSAYFLSRRSLRLWPIVGRSRDELWKATGKFIKEDLEFAALTESMIESISRPDFPSGPSAKDEALIRFRDADVRDSIMGALGKLASKIDISGKPTAGIRIEITPALRPALKVLEKYGQQLRARHGPGTRRHFKFDDIDRTLYLNVKLPGDQSWSKVTLDIARRGVTARERFASEKMERRFDINGPRAPPAPDRPASVSSGSGAAPWTGANATVLGR